MCFSPWEKKRLSYFSCRRGKVAKEPASVPLDRFVQGRIAYRRLPTRVCAGKPHKPRRNTPNGKQYQMRSFAPAGASAQEASVFSHLPPAFRRAGKVAQCGFGYDAPPTAVGKLPPLFLLPHGVFRDPFGAPLERPTTRTLFVERVCGSRRDKYPSRTAESEVEPRRLFCNFSSRGEKLGRKL